jgi:hypothetical protein
MSRVFYLQLEEGVRNAVRVLRNNGINTICSCHHEGYIQAESCDPYTEQVAILNSMSELGVDKWTAVLTIEYLPTYWHSCWEIKAEAFRAAEDEHV